ncbi:MAG: hypothetical protein GY799_04585 [Desulfobulbaceae bacterium]|nr:hypothetical protein [Desulfobulbaceae bacterium]
MLAMVVLGLFSRVASILALLLPVKILLLVGNKRVPAYFPTFLHEFQLDTLISLLCGATILLYASYVGLEKLISGIECKAECLLVTRLAPAASDSRSIRTLRIAYSRVSENLTWLCFILSVNGVVNHGNHHKAGWLLVNFSFNYSCGATEAGMVADRHT